MNLKCPHCGNEFVYPKESYCPKCGTWTTQDLNVDDVFRNFFNDKNPIENQSGQVPVSHISNNSVPRTQHGGIEIPLQQDTAKQPRDFRQVPPNKSQHSDLYIPLIDSPREQGRSAHYNTYSPYEEYAHAGAGGTKTSSNKEVILFVVIGLLLIVALSVFFFIPKSDSASTPSKTESSKELNSYLSDLTSNEEELFKNYQVEFDTSESDAANTIQQWILTDKNTPELMRHAAVYSYEKGDEIFATKIALSLYNTNKSSRDLDFVSAITAPSDFFKSGTIANEALRNLFETSVSNLTWQDIGRVKYFYSDSEEFTIGFNSEEYYFLEMDGTRTAMPYGLFALEYAYLDTPDPNNNMEWFYINNLVDLSVINAVQLDDLSKISHLFDLEALYISGRTLSSVDGLENFQKLQYLDIEDTKITSIPAERISPDLVSFHLVDNQNLSNINIIKNLPDLERLSLVGDSFSDFSPLYGLNKLIYLDISDSNIKDLSFLEEFDTLKYVYILKNDDLLSVAPLKNHTGITHLDIDASLDGIEVISGFKELEELELSRPHSLQYLSGLTNIDSLTIMNASFLDNLSPIGNLTNLITLTIDESSYDTTFSNYHYYFSLAFLENLQNLESLNLSGGASYFGDCSSIFSLEKLHSLSLHHGTFNVGNSPDFSTLKNLVSMDITETKFLYNVQINQSGMVTDIYYDTHTPETIAKALENTSNLEILFCDSQKLENIDFVKTLPNLVVVSFADNYITDFEPLLSLSRLQYAYITDNPIKDTSKLEEADFYIAF